MYDQKCELAYWVVVEVQQADCETVLERRLPHTGIDTRPGVNAAGCSLLGAHLCFLLGLYTRRLIKTW